MRRKLGWEGEREREGGEENLRLDGVFPALPFAFGKIQPARKTGLPWMTENVSAAVKPNPLHVVQLAQTSNAEGMRPTCAFAQVGARTGALPQGAADAALTIKNPEFLLCI